MLSGVFLLANCLKIVTNWAVRSTFEESTAPAVTGSLSCKLPLECQLPSTLKFGAESQWQVRWEVQTSAGSLSSLSKQEYERHPRSRGTWNWIASKEGTSGSHKSQTDYENLVWNRDAVSVQLAWSLVWELHACPQIYVKQEKLRAGLWTQNSTFTTRCPSPLVTTLCVT